MGRPVKDLTGKTFEELTVVERRENIGKHAAWLCKCSCGNYRIVASQNLLNGSTKTCGHDKPERNNLEIGKQYGGLTLLERFSDVNGKTMCKCKCFCGNEVIIPIKKIHYKLKSCGCIENNKNVYIEHENFFECVMSCGLSFKIDKDDYDKVSKQKWHYDGKYVKGNTNKTRLHRFILGEPDGVVDHINGDCLDNRKVNLRVCGQWQNTMNRGAQKNNESGYKGVSYSNGMKGYYAQLSNGGQRYHIGYFKTPEEAAVEYDKLALKYFGEFAYTNFPKENYENEVEKQ